MELMERAKALEGDLIRWRRHLHRYPETGTREQGTLRWLERELDALGLPWTTVDPGGIVAVLEGASDGRHVLLRGDIDALPVAEDRNNLKGPKVCVSEVPGVSHACGHDAHTAMLLGQAKLLKAMQAQLRGKIYFYFEQGEEGFDCVEQILLWLERQQIRIDACYGAHVRWDIPAGRIYLCDTTCMTGIYRFQCRIFGKSGHGARPDLAVSPIDCFTALYDRLQRAWRQTPGLVFSVGRLQSGTADNVIPGELTFRGTFRCARPETGDGFWAEFHRLLDESCAANRCRGALELVYRHLPVISEPNCLRLCREAVTRRLGPELLYDGEPWAASESFGYLLARYPGVYAFLGIRNDELGSGANHHCAQFDLDESAMVAGTAAGVAFALEFLERGETPGFVPRMPDAQSVLTYCHTG